MIKLKEIYQINIHTHNHHLPVHVNQNIHMGGSGFIVNREQSFHWGDYVVVDEYNRISGMTKEHVETIRKNAVVINSNIIDAPQVSQPMTDRISLVEMPIKKKITDTVADQSVTGVVSFPNGLTVRQLKAIINTWPEEKADGAPTEVWVSEDDVSNVVRTIWPLDVDSDNKADILLDTEVL